MDISSLLPYMLSVMRVSLSELCIVAAVVFGGAILRGITGFGFSLALVVVLTIFMPPAQAASFILLWEIMASVVHLPFLWQYVHWKMLRWLTVGVILGTPLGVASLVIISPIPMTIAINVTVIILSLFILQGFHMKRHLSSMEIMGTGIVSGIINGASANGGPPVILLFFSSPSGAAVGRATIIAYFFITDVWASAIFAQQGLTTLDTVWVALLFVPFMVAGLFIGHKLYGKFDEEKFKKGAIMFLIVVSALSCTRLLFFSE